MLGGICSFLGSLRVDLDYFGEIGEILALLKGVTIKFTP
jgi:hypothetical protein